MPDRIVIPPVPAVPLDTEAQVRTLPAVRAVYVAFDADPGVGKMAPHSHRMLCEAISAASVELGAYDHQIIEWLAGWEPQTCAVIAGLITRARASGVVRQASSCQRCGSQAPDGNDLCGPCEETEGADALAALRSLADGEQVRS